MADLGPDLDGIIIQKWMPRKEDVTKDRVQ
jgi:hypothetical protein